LKHLITLILMAILFAGCMQKQVGLKMPEVSDDKTTIIDKFISNDKVIQEEIIDTYTIQDTKSIIINNVDETKADTKVAFIYPSSLLYKYARSSINTASGYLSFIKTNYNLVVIDSVNENMDSIEQAFDRVKEEGITKVIALYTPNAINNINKIALENILVYLPLIEKKESLETNNNLIFGSISYEEQLKKLSYYSDGANILFYQDTYLGNKLKNAYETVVQGTTVRKEIKKDETNFKAIVSDARLKNSFLFLNTDIVKSALILSQLRANNIYPQMIFSTQINFDPVLMSLTQDEDRKKLVLANSIEDVNSKLKDEIVSYGGNIIYEWVDYSTLVGINYLINGNNDFIATKIVENQAVYVPRIFKSTAYGFVEIK